MVFEKIAVIPFQPEKWRQRPAEEHDTGSPFLPPRNALVAHYGNLN